MQVLEIACFEGQNANYTQQNATIIHQHKFGRNQTSCREIRPCKSTRQWREIERPTTTRAISHRIGGGELLAPLRSEMEANLFKPLLHWAQSLVGLHVDSSPAPRAYLSYYFRGLQFSDPLFFCLRTVSGNQSEGILNRADPERKEHWKARVIFFRPACRCVLPRPFSTLFCPRRRHPPAAPSVKATKVR